MKILVVSNMYPDKSHPFYGTFVKNFCDQLPSININFELSIMKKKDLKLEKIYNYMKFILGTIFKILFQKYDAIYIHYASISSIPVIVAHIFKRNLVIYTNVHGSDVVPENKKHQLFHMFTKKILKISNKIIVPSLYFKDYVVSKYNLDQNIIYIYSSGGVNPNIFYKMDDNLYNEIFEEFHLSVNQKYVAYVGRITKDKGWDIYCYALKKIVEKNNNIMGLIVGSGNEYQKLIDLTKKLEIYEKIVFLPLLSQENLNKIYNIIECLVFPSKREGESLGLIPLEAMSSGAIVLVNGMAAPSKYITDKCDGFIYKKNDVDSLTENIEYIINLNIYERKYITDNALSKCAEYYPDNLNKFLKEIFYK